MASATAQALGLDTEYPLTDEQVTSLRDDGWAALPALLSKEAVEATRTRLADQPLRPGSVGLGKSAKNSNVNHQAMAWRDPFFHAVATSRRVAGTAVRLMKQPTALLAQDITFIKPGEGAPTNPHQDYCYKPADRWGEVAIWIALVDISEDMGPLYYLKRSHKEGPLGLHHGKDIRDQHPHLFDYEIVGGKAMAAGDAQAHWDLTVHGAAPNTTNRDREAYVPRYMRSDTCYTGISYGFYDAMELKPGSRYADSGNFPLVGPEGLIEDYDPEKAKLAADSPAIRP
jgi:ectoine hydroxylase-related dioxygenase (phytanoyl-CoA dioxygenase family)